MFSSRAFGVGSGGGGGGSSGGAGESPRSATGRPYSADPDLRREGTGPATAVEIPDRPHGHSRSRTSSRDEAYFPAELASVYGNPAGRMRSGGAVSGWDRGGTDEELWGRGSVSSGGGGSGSGGSGGGGWVGGFASRGGGEARRLARKVGALIRDRSPCSGLEGFHVEEARLRLWVREMRLWVI